MEKNRLLVIDIETTGFNSLMDRIVEIGGSLLNTKDGTIEEAFNMFILEEDVEEIANKPNHGWIFDNSDLTLKDVLEKGVSIESIQKELQDYFDRYETTAFNKRFDFGFLKARGFKFPNVGKDPMYISTNILKLYKSSGGYKWPKCQEALDFFEIKETEPHRAAEDSRLEAMIIWKLIQMKKW